MQLLYNTQMNRFNYHSRVSFQMRKNEFSGIDRKVIEDKRVDVGPFKEKTEFDAYCNGLIDEVKKENIDEINEETNEKRKTETKIKRQDMLQEWFDYVLNENDAYTPAAAYMILQGITKDLKPDNDKLPPALHRDVLAKTVDDIQKVTENEINTNNLKNISFLKEYKFNLQKTLCSVDDDKKDNNLNGWIIIPSKKQDSENFDKNVEKLKLLSHSNWCTKNTRAGSYLANGECHIYMDNGKPRLCVRFVGDEILEIQGPKNDSKIPIKYSDIAEKHIQNYKLTDNAEIPLEHLKATKEKIAKIKKALPKGIENSTTQEILEAVGVKCKKDKDGLLIISHYCIPDADFTFADLGIKENKFFKDIKEIEGYASFSKDITSLGNLEKIGGIAYIGNKKSLGKLQSIGGDAYFGDVESLGKLQSIGGDAHFRNIKSLGELQSIGGDADFSYSQIKSLGKLKKIGGNADFNYSQITDLGELQRIGKDARIKYSLLKPADFINISVGGSIDGYNRISRLIDKAKLIFNKNRNDNA